MQLVIFINYFTNFYILLISTQEKLLACGDYGIGGLADKEVIIEPILKQI